MITISPTYLIVYMDKREPLCVSVWFSGVFLREKNCENGKLSGTRRSCHETWALLVIQDGWLSINTKPV